MNRTFAFARDEEHFKRCWKLSNCGDCMGKESDCSWCPFSWTCVPNPYSIPLLAPAYDENICPHWAERWEIRSRPLGCQVSTITTLTSIVTIFSTIAFFLLLFLFVFLARRAAAYHRTHAGWWRFWAWDWKGTVAAVHDRCGRLLGRFGKKRNDGHRKTDARRVSAETEPLLPS